MIIVFQIFYYENLFSRLSTKVRDFVRTQLREFQYLDDGQFKTLPEYPEIAPFLAIISEL